MELTFVQGQVVWAKLGGFPWWPASIKQVLAPNCFEVEYFGEFERNYFDRARVRHFDKPPEKINRRNSKLMQSVAQAQRVIRGETTVEEERANFFLLAPKPEISKLSLKRCATQHELSTHYSTGVLRAETRASFEREAESELPKESFVESVPMVGEGQFIKTEIKKSKKVKGLQPTTRKKRVAKAGRRIQVLDLNRHLSLPADVFKKRINLPLVGGMLTEELGPVSEGPRSPPHEIEDLSEAQGLENQLREILAALGKERPPIVEIQAKLTRWMAEFSANETKIEQIFQTQVGPLLVEIIARCATLSAKPVFRELHSTTLGILNAIRVRLLSGFFKADHLASPRTTLSIASLPNHIVDRKKPFDIAPDILNQSCPQSSNCVLPDLCETENTPNLKHTMSLNFDKKENDPRTVSEEDVFKISRKLARLLFEKVARGRRSRAECEQTANLIESKIRANSTTRGEYQAKWVYLFHRLEYNSDRFLAKLKGSGFGPLGRPIVDALQSFVIGN